MDLDTPAEDVMYDDDVIVAEEDDPMYEGMAISAMPTPAIVPVDEDVAFMPTPVAVPVELAVENEDISFAAEVEEEGIETEGAVGGEVEGEGVIDAEVIVGGDEGVIGAEEVGETEEYEEEYDMDAALVEDEGNVTVEDAPEEAATEQRPAAIEPPASTLISVPEHDAHPATDVLEYEHSHDDVHPVTDDIEADLEALAPILLHTSLGTSALFCSPEYEDGGEQPDIPVLLAGRDDLADEGLNVMFRHLRAELEKAGEEATGEMIVTEKEMGLVMGEDDINLASVTMLDILALHEGCGLPTPVQLFVTTQPHRFISRFEAIRREIEAAEERERSAEGEECAKEAEVDELELQLEGADEGVVAGALGDDEWAEYTEDAYEEGAYDADDAAHADEGEGEGHAEEHVEEEEEEEAGEHAEDGEVEPAETEGATVIATSVAEGEEEYNDDGEYDETAEDGEHEHDDAPAPSTIATEGAETADAPTNVDPHVVKPKLEPAADELVADAKAEAETAGNDHPEAEAATVEHADAEIDAEAEHGTAKPEHPDDTSEAAEDEGVDEYGLSQITDAALAASAEDPEAEARASLAPTISEEEDELADDGDHAPEVEEDELAGDDEREYTANHETEADNGEHAEHEEYNADYAEDGEYEEEEGEYEEGEYEGEDEYEGEEEEEYQEGEEGAYVEGEEGAHVEEEGESDDLEGVVEDGEGGEGEDGEAGEGEVEKTNGNASPRKRSLEDDGDEAVVKKTKVDA